jgi:hypothetical protein
MPYRLSYLDDDEIVFTEYELPLGAHEVIRAAAASISMAEQHGARRFLGDCRALDSPPEIPDGAFVGEVVHRLGADARFVEALVVPQEPEAKAAFEAYARAAAKSGVTVRLFAALPEAKRWLRGSPAADR